MRVVTYSWTITASLLLAALVKYFFFFILLCLSCCLLSHIINSWRAKQCTSMVIDFIIVVVSVGSYPKRKKVSPKSQISQMYTSKAHLEVCPVIIISPAILLPALVTSSSRLGSRRTRCCRGRGSSPVAGRRSSSRRRRVRVGPRDTHSSSLITATIVGSVSKTVVVAVVTVAVIRSGRRVVVTNWGLVLLFVMVHGRVKEIIAAAIAASLLVV